MVEDESKVDKAKRRQGGCRRDEEVMQDEEGE